MAGIYLLPLELNDPTVRVALGVGAYGHTPLPVIPRQTQREREISTYDEPVERCPNTDTLRVISSLVRRPFPTSSISSAAVQRS